MTNRSPSFLSGSSSLASDYNTKIFGSSATPVFASEQYADYGFIAVLGLAQRLHVHFLPITWQAALGRIGKGGEARINQVLANIQTSFAFKLFNHQLQHPFREIVQEMVVLSHPVVRNNEHIVRLEGICWDISEEDQVWPVLVFQKSHLGDLHNFAKLERYEKLSMEDKLNLCVDIGIAIGDMHHNGIIHGDIKPQNVLAFEEGSRIIAKVADFGFATCFQGQNNLISMPKSEPWNAPEYHHRPIRPEQAKQMDVYSFGMLCFWLIFEAGSPSDLPLSPYMVLESNQFISFERCQLEKNLLRDWKRNSNKLVEWVCWLVHEDGRFDSSMKDNLVQFFQSTLAFDPKLRCKDLARLLDNLVPHRVLPKTESVEMDAVLKHEDFEIPPSIYEFYGADFRLRGFIFQCLGSMATESAESTMQHISPVKAALQLALSYTIGFGTTKDDNQATFLLNKYSLEHADLQSCVQLINDGIEGSLSEQTLYLSLERQGQIQKIDFPQHYRERHLLERAEACYRQDIQNTHLIFGQTHRLYLLSMSRLARLIASQGRWNEAEELEAQVMETEKEVLGAEHPDTMNSMAHLALLKFWDQDRWNEAEELAVEVAEMSSRVLGAEHSETLVSVGHLARMYRYQGRLDEAEKLETQVMESNLTVLGTEHPNTLISMNNLAAVLMEKGQWKEGEQLSLHVMETSKRVLDIEHPDTLHSMNNVASIYDIQGRWKEAEELTSQVLETRKKVLGPEHPDTLISMNNLASTYMKQGRLEEAQQLELYVTETRKRVLGEEHIDTLTIMNNLAITYTKGGQLKEAEELSLQVVEAQSRVLGKEHPDTLNSMNNHGMILNDQGRYAEAEAILRRSLIGCEKVLAPEHPNTLAVVDNLGIVLQGEARYEEAEAMHQRALVYYEEVLGPKHPRTLNSVDNLGVVLRDQGKYNEAEAMHRRALLCYEELLGPEHPDTLTCKANLAGTYWSQDRRHEALVLMRSVEKLFVKIAGDDHPHSVTIRETLQAWEAA